MQRALFSIAGALMIILGVMHVAPVAVAYAGGETAAVATAEPETKAEGSAKVSVPDVSVEGGDSDGAWYLNPVWIVVGLLAIGVLIAIIAAASRSGGGTTVVK